MSAIKLAVSQRGVGILMALMVVAVVASVLAGVAVTTNYSVRRSGVISHLQQAQAYNDGLTLYAKRILQIDALSTTHDSQDEDWAQVMPAYPVDGGRVGGHINELSSRFNLAGLRIENPFEERVFKRLFQNLGGTVKQAEQVIQMVSSGQVADVIGAFTAAEVGEELLVQMANYFCFLPINAEKLNINVVSPQVLAAYLRITAARAEEILRQLRKAPAIDEQALLDFANRNGIGQIGIDASKAQSASVIDLRFGVKSRYFQLVAESFVGDAEATSVTVVDRNGNNVAVLSRRLNKLPTE